MYRDYRKVCKINCMIVFNLIDLCDLWHEKDFTITGHVTIEHLSTPVNVNLMTQHAKRVVH